MPKYIIGYDPGGNDKHGVCVWELDETDEVISIEYAPPKLESFQKTLEYCKEFTNGLVAIGIDTFTSWSTGPSGWRPADRYLNEKYPKVRVGKDKKEQRSNSTISLNSTFSSMSINGAMFLKWALENSQAVITEAHPKVCYYALTEGLYDPDNINGMYKNLLEGDVFHFLEKFPQPSNEHQFDACIAALAAYSCHLKIWKFDLHKLKWEDYFEDEKGEVIFPFGRIPSRIFYSWPGPIKEH